LSDADGIAAGPFELGHKAFSTGQYEQAIAEFEKAVQQEGGNSDYHLWLARAYGQRTLQVKSSEQFFLARKVKTQLEQAVALNPDNIAARFDLLQYHLRAPGVVGGSREEAQRQAEEIARRDAQQGGAARRLCEQAAGILQGE
jgi:tetratricopeptide (TPR) repeat protein